MNLPQKYLDTMKDMLGDEFDAYLDSFNDSRYYGLRVNTLKITPEDFISVRMISRPSIRITMPDFTIYRSRVQ